MRRDMDEEGEEVRADPAAGVGAQLRHARETQGLALADVAERTRIPTRHLVMIEEGNLASLPAPTYAVGFVKTYARLLGLESQPLAAQFRRELAHAAPRDVAPQRYEPADPARTPTRGLAWAGLVLAVLLAGVYLYWRGTRDEDATRLAAATRDRPAAAAPTVAPVPVPPPAAPGVTRTALLTATSPVWIKVYEPDGPTHFMGMLQAGDHYAVPADAPDPRLLTGRPNALDVTVGATRVPPLGAPEHRIKDVSLRPAALLAGAAPAPTAPPAATTPVENSAAPQG